MRDLIQELLSHYGELRRHLVRELKDTHHAADIAQSTFERVYAQAVEPKARPIDSPRALLFHVARNLCIDDARRRQVALAWRDRELGTAPLAAPPTDCIAAGRQVLARVVHTLAQLPPRRREVFLLFRAYGHSRAEIAERLGITEMAVAKHLVRATIDCARVFADLRGELIEPPVATNRPGADPRLAEDWA